MSEKLVRNKMPKLCAVHPERTPMVWRPVRDELEHLEFLGQKLLEESNELVNAIKVGELTHIVEELADVEEVIRTISKLKRVKSLVECTRRIKAQERGGLDHGVIWDGKK